MMKMMRMMRMIDGDEGDEDEDDDNEDGCMDGADGHGKDDEVGEGISGEGYQVWHGVLEGTGWREVMEERERREGMEGRQGWGGR